MENELSIFFLRHGRSGGDDEGVHEGRYDAPLTAVGYEQVRRRVAARAVEKIVRRGPGQYLVVAHGGILNAAMRTIVGASPLLNGHGLYFALGDTGYAQVIYVPERHHWIIGEVQPEHQTYWHKEDTL